MTTSPQLTSEQIVAIALAHEYISSSVLATGAAPDLTTTLAHVRQTMSGEVDRICDAIGISLRTEKAVKGTVDLLALLFKQVGKARNGQR